MRSCGGRPYPRRLGEAASLRVERIGLLCSLDIDDRHKSGRSRGRRGGSEAADGETALKALESAPRVNLLFTDVVLPGGMNGPELAAEVRSRFPGIAVLYTSGYPELANFPESAFPEGADLLQKPYRKADLARKIRDALDGTNS